MDADYITLRKGSERDRELDTIIGNIQKASQVGVKISLITGPSYRSDGTGKLQDVVKSATLAFSSRRTGRTCPSVNQAGSVPKTTGNESPIFLTK
jgi:hypothetical protein